MAPDKRQRPRRYRRRVIAVQAAFVLALGAVAVRIHYVQNAYGPKLVSAADQLQNVKQVMLAQRGALLDRNGQRLAYDVPAYLMDLKTSDFSDLAGLASLLSPILKSPESTVLQWLQNRKGWAHWSTPVMEPDKESITKAIDGILKPQKKDHNDAVTFTPTEERIYPYGSFAANTLGFVDHSGKGSAGLEAQYNTLLSGTDGEVTFTRDRWGFPLQTTVQTTKQAVPGKDIQLTIDQTIQGFVETKMDQLVSQYKPEHAAIIVTDPKTGEILGMSSRPTYDPNKYWEANPTSALSENWAINDAFEPGSTMKTFVLAAGLAQHVISLDDKFLSGHMTVQGQTLHDWKPAGWGVIDFRHALEYSSNVGAATVALKLQWPHLLQYLNSFGLLSKTGVDLPAEGNSLMFAPQYRGKVELATTGFGQGIAVTPIQQMAAMGVFANGGKLIQPHLAKAIIDPDTGNVVKQIAPKVINPQVVPPDVVDQMNQTLILDVSDGIDNLGQLPGYDVAGKTGTANIPDPTTHKYYADRFNTSFLGYAPGWDPKVEVYVTLYWPKTTAGNQWGSSIATPAARDIMQECMQYYHIAPRTSGTKSDKGATTPAQGVATTTRYVETPELSGKTASQAQGILKKLGLIADFMGQNGAVKTQWPAAGVEVPVGSRMYVWAPNAGAAGAVMPDLRGSSMREAGNILAAMGVQMQPKGDGFAVAQSIAPGKPVAAGTSVEVDFEPPRDPVTASIASAAQNGSASAGTPGSGGAGH